MAAPGYEKFDIQLRERLEYLMTDPNIRIRAGYNGYVNEVLKQVLKQGGVEGIRAVQSEAVMTLDPNGKTLDVWNMGCADVINNEIKVAQSDQEVARYSELTPELKEEIMQLMNPKNAESVDLPQYKMLVEQSVGRMLAEVGVEKAYLILNDAAKAFEQKDEFKQVWDEAFKSSMDKSRAEQPLVKTKSSVSSSIYGTVRKAQSIIAEAKAGDLKDRINDLVDDKSAISKSDPEAYKRQVESIIEEVSKKHGAEIAEKIVERIEGRDQGKGEVWREVFQEKIEYKDADKEIAKDLKLLNEQGMEREGKSKVEIKASQVKDKIVEAKDKVVDKAKSWAEKIKSERGANKGQGGPGVG